MYLSKQYDEVLSAGIAIESTVRAMVTVACRYMTSIGHSSPQKSAVALIEQLLSLSCEKLKEKFSRTSADNSTKITE